MKVKKVAESMELSIFEVGNLLCTVDIKHIQEINKHLEVTQVYNAPDYVKGIMNLRGQIVTVIDLRVKFGFEPLNVNQKMRVIVINYQDEKIGLLVDKIIDVATTDADSLEPPPSNINGVAGEYFSSIYKMQNGLAAVLNIEEILKMETQTSSASL